MSFKDWLRDATSGSGKGRSKKELSVDDLINLERYEEALQLLKERVKSRQNDHHSRLKMAELLMKVSKRSEAVEEYLKVSEGFERDGFYNKASALITRVARLVPNDERLMVKAQRLDRIKRLDHLRRLVTDSLPHATGMKVEKDWTSFVHGRLLTRLSEEQLKRLLPQLSLREFDEEQEVVSAGVRQDELLWIVSGEISARVVLPNGSTTDIRTFQGGALIGERALLSRQPWAAVYAAAKRSAVLVLDRESLEKSLVGEDDPRGFLEALRADRNDEAVHQAVAKMAEMRREE